VADPLHHQISVALGQYSRSVAVQVDQAAARSMARFKKRSIADMPVGRRLTKRKSDIDREHLFQSIRSKKTVDTNAASVFIWYVDKPNYRLTHLIENPRKARNGRIIPGRYILRKILDEEAPRYEAEIKEIVRDGG